jgi:YggT family protein
VTLPLAAVRDTVADYLVALLGVYTLLIFVYIIASMVLSFGVRIPYNRATDAVLTFLREVCDPYLRIFRRFVPMIGPLDLSPIVAIFVLRIVGAIVVNVIRG